MTVVINNVLNDGGTFAINTHTLEFTRGEYLLAGSDLQLVAIPERYFSNYCDIKAKLKTLDLNRYVAFSMGLFFQSHDPRVEYFDVVINWMTDSGIIDGLFRKVLPFAGLKYQEKVEENPLILEHFVLSMIAALAGLVIATVSFAAELGKTCSSKKVRRLQLI